MSSFLPRTSTKRRKGESSRVNDLEGDGRDVRPDRGAVMGVFWQIVDWLLEPEASGAQDQAEPAQLDESWANAGTGAVITVLAVLAMFAAVIAGAS